MARLRGTNPALLLSCDSSNGLAILFLPPQSVAKQQARRWPTHTHLHSICRTRLIFLSVALDFRNLPLSSCLRSPLTCRSKYTGKRRKNGWRALSGATSPSEMSTRSFIHCAPTTTHPIGRVQITRPWNTLGRDRWPLSL